MDTTLRKGLAVLEVLSALAKPGGVTQVAQELGLVKSRVHRLLKTLCDCGYVRQDEASGRYECTLKVWELGASVYERLDVRPAARPCLEALAARTQETVHLSVLDGAEILYIDKIDSPQPVRAYSRIGGRAPAYCVATGKALLAYAPKDVFDKVAASLRQHTRRTIAKRDELCKELERIREAGYAINRGEWRDGVVGVAAAVVDPRGGALAAIGISGPVDRLSQSRLREVAPLVVGASRSTARALGL